MVTDRRARKLFLLCDKLGINGVEQYVEDGRFGAEKLPLVNAWLDIKIKEATEKAQKSLVKASTQKPLSPKKKKSVTK